MKEITLKKDKTYEEFKTRKELYELDVKIKSIKKIYK